MFFPLGRCRIGPGGGGGGFVFEEKLGPFAVSCFGKNFPSKAIKMKNLPLLGEMMRKV